MSLRNPVKYPVKYYSWQDAQAPQLSNADGVIKTILKACLVTGYGSKQGASWTSLFEDDYRIVLRRPLRAGNPPDIKIENGTITGTTIRHRIVAQDNPTGLDDATELSEVNLLARDTLADKEWHCIVTDFGFLFCYAMGAYQWSGIKREFLYVGSTLNLKNTAEDNFVATYNASVNTNGMALTYMSDFIRNGNVVDMKTKNIMSQKRYHNFNKDELFYDNQYTAQQIFINDEIVPPWLLTMCFNTTDYTTKLVTVDGRQMLRYVNIQYDPSRGYNIMYIPLDWWLL